MGILEKLALRIGMPEIRKCYKYESGEKWEGASEHKQARAFR